MQQQAIRVSLREKVDYLEIRCNVVDVCRINENGKVESDNVELFAICRVESKCVEISSS